MGRMSHADAIVEDEVSRLRAELASREREVVALRRVALAMNASLELDGLLETIVQVALELTGGRRAHVVWRDDQELDRLLQAPVRGGSWRMPEDAVRKVEAVRHTLATGEPAHDEERLLVCLPLVAPGQVLGALCVEGQMPGQDAVADLHVLAAHAAIALEQAVLFAALRRRSVELEATLRRYHEAEHASLTDPLTNLANKRHFRDQGKREAAVAKRYGRPLSLIIADIDHFKRVNDTYGHLRGDDVLKSVSATLSRTVRGADLLARWGGEEFVVLCPATGPDEALKLAERIRAAIEAMHGPVPGITISLGVATHAPDEELDATLDRADRALLRAKEAGRNQVQS
ncbi:MAG: diguanylate cyclase/phosphodiesterase domain 1 [Cyanobacteria bacterium RYN_339]|nr:diguanylate cyclase/phosphodiesterase domain 1 [Cyanobacteria bacterium RYN_339]